MTTAEIKSKIEKLQKGVDSPAVPENLKGAMRQQIEKLSGQLGEEKPQAKAKKPAPKVKKAPAPKKAKAEPAEKKFIMFEGKKIFESDADYCEKLVKAWKAKREKAKKDGKKYRAEPVIRKVARDVVDSVEKAVHNVSANEIKKNPKAFAKKVHNLEKSAKEFLQSFKSILGTDFKKKEIWREFSELENLINSLLKQYGKEKMAGGGKVEKEGRDKVYIDFLNKKKGFIQDRKHFDSYEKAEKWAKANFERFDPDMIKYQMAGGGKVFGDQYGVHNVEKGTHSLHTEVGVIEYANSKFQYESADADEKIETIEDAIRELEAIEYKITKVSKSGSRIKSAINRDRKYKSDQPHELKYKRKTSPKNPRYKADKGSKAGAAAFIQLQGELVDIAIDMEGEDEEAVASFRGELDDAKSQSEIDKALKEYSTGWAPQISDKKAKKLIKESITKYRKSIS